MLLLKDPVDERWSLMEDNIKIRMVSRLSCAFFQALIFVLIFNSWHKFSCSVQSIPVLLSFFPFLQFFLNSLVYIKFFLSPLQLYQVFQFLSSFMQYAPLWDVWRSCWDPVNLWGCPYFSDGLHFLGLPPFGRYTYFEIFLFTGVIIRLFQFFM